MDALWNFDLHVFRAVHIGWHSDILNVFFGILSTTGLDYVQIALFLVFGSPLCQKLRLPNLAQGREAWMWPLLGCWALSGVVNSFILKQLIYRERPSLLAWAHPQENLSYHSFPSGHTAISFAAATGLFWLLRNSKHSRVCWVPYVWALGVGLSRIYRGVHWPTDVLGGALVGLMCGTAVMALYRPKTED